MGGRLAQVTSDFRVHLHYHHPSDTEAAGAFTGDLTDPEHFEMLIDKLDPDIIINCAALADVDRCETDPDLSQSINVKAVSNLLGSFPHAKFVQISTDYVFGDDEKRGSSPPKPDDQPSPMNIYGRHKLDAERTTLTASPDNLVIRVNTVYDHVDKRNFFRFVFDSLAAGKNIYGLTDLISNPISAFSAAKLIVRLIEREATGIFHLGGSDFVSRYEFACRIAAFFNFDSGLIEASTMNTLHRPASRLRYAGLECRATEEFLQLSMPNLIDEFVCLKAERQQNIT